MSSLTNGLINNLANSLVISAPASTQVPNQQVPAENPLDKLRDIHLPDQIDSFPSAPGWWLLLTVILITAGYFIFKRYQYKKAIRLLKPAKAELEKLRSLPSQAINAHSIATLSALLKRICLIYFPNLEVASLSGQHWLKFLNHQKAKDNTGEAFFSPENIQLFCETPYQKKTNINEPDWMSLISASESCITQIIVSAAKHKRSEVSA